MLFNVNYVLLIFMVLLPFLCLTLCDPFFLILSVYSFICFFFLIFFLCLVWLILFHLLFSYSFPLPFLCLPSTFSCFLYSHLFSRFVTRSFLLESGWVCSFQVSLTELNLSLCLFSNVFLLLLLHLFQGLVLSFGFLMISFLILCGAKIVNIIAVLVCFWCSVLCISSNTTSPYIRFQSVELPQMPQIHY